MDKLGIGFSAAGIGIAAALSFLRVADVTLHPAIWIPGVSLSVALAVFGIYLVVKGYQEREVIAPPHRGITAVKLGKHSIARRLALHLRSGSTGVDATSGDALIEDVDVREIESGDG